MSETTDPKSQPPTISGSGRHLDFDPIVGKDFAERYQITSVLGRGGMSVVYRARHKLMDRIVAIKVLHAHLVSEPTAEQRFQQEARAASSLSHQNIISVHDFGFTPEGQAFFVMDYLEGPDLSEIINEHGTLELPRAIHIFAQACEGLEHAHKKGIIHRDLKPSNLVITRQEDGSELVKIVDFGIAKIINPSEKDQQKLTQTGEIFGSPLYMSPEQCNALALDARSDIYSMGCLMYEALAKEPPHVGDTFINTVIKHINEKPKPFRVINPNLEIPEAIETVIFTCLEKSPAKRYQSAAELKHALLQAALQAGVTGVQPSATINMAGISTNLQGFPSRTNSSRGGHLAKIADNKLLVSVTVILVLVLALAAWLLFQPGPPEDRGSNYLKLWWNIHMKLADQARNVGNLPLAIKTLQDAEKICENFGDDHSRLIATLNTEVAIYAEMHKFPEQEQVNKRIIKLTEEQAVNDSNIAMSVLQQLLSHNKSSTEKTLSALEAESLCQRILHSTRRIVSLNLNARAERLLLQAIKTYSTLLGKNHSTVSDFKLELAQLYRQQQRNKEVLPLLTDAVRICEGNFQPDDRISRVDLCEAQLKLGQFARDQSMDREAREYLSRALTGARELKPSDPELLSKCLNSYADYLNRVGHTHEAEQKFDEARQLLDKEKQ